MQLFQLAKEQLKYINELVPRIATKVEEGTILQNVDIPLRHFSAKGKSKALAPGEPRDFQGIDLQVCTGDDGLINYPAIEKGMNEFVALALVMAFNATQKDCLNCDKPDVILKASPKDEEELLLRFSSIQPHHFGIHAASQALDKLEALMFKGWHPVEGMTEPMLRKTFASEDDCTCAEYLIEARGRAMGYTHDEIEQCFDTSPNDRTITVYQDFLEQLAKVEQTLEADFGNRIH
jgi:hypothetical protein